MRCDGSARILKRPSGRLISDALNDVVLLVLVKGALAA
jgi:hypothetical protein